MLAWINELTDLPDWQNKIFDPEFTFEWKSAKVMTGYDVVRSMADWVGRFVLSIRIPDGSQCVEEVKHYTRDSVASSLIPSLNGGVIKSDVCVDTTTNLTLKQAAHVLRRTIKDHRDMLDLVDPFLFPFAWERTRLLRKGSIRSIDCIPRCGEGQLAKMPPEDDCKEPDHGRYRNDMAYSRRFQWLPFDVVFDNNGVGQSRSVGRGCQHIRI